MIHLERLPEPDVLIRKKTEWLQRFLASGKDRPTSSTYGHPEIRATLYTISHNKCFYCERKLQERESEVDHYIEIAVERSSSFNWENLFLSCDNCNKKIQHDVIPVEHALNPFLHTDAQIEEHITFSDEIIRMKNHSEIGENTIKKFRLDKLEHIRLQYFKAFANEYMYVSDQARADGREFTEEEKESLRSYSYPDRPFSLMFKVILRKRNLM